MSTSADAFSNNAYEYVFLAHTGAKSQGNLNDIDQETRRERLSHGRSVDQYVDMNTVFNIPLDDDKPQKELQRGKSEDLDSRRPKHEPIAITSVYENMVVKQQNPRRKLRRNIDYDDYEFPLKGDEPVKTSSSAPASTFVSSAFIMIKDDYDDGKINDSKEIKNINIPLSPTNYQQPPTPDHPPPSAMQAENIIHDRIRPLSQVS